MAKKKDKKVIQMPTSPENYIKTRARNLPVGKCYINENWAESGFASIAVSRNHINGNFTFAVYLVDLFCLGVKDTFYDFNVNAQFTDLLEKLKSQQPMKEIEYPLAHNIIYGGVEYAADLGFKPHNDFEISQYLLEEDDDRVELIDVQFGMNGKPAILIGKEKHPANIIATLERSVGKGNFIIMDEEDFGENEEDFDEDDFDGEDDEELTVDEITDVLAGKKKTSPRNLARIAFVMYDEQCSKEKSAEMAEILEEFEKLEFVDEDKTEEPFFLNKENEVIYDSIFDEAVKNPVKAIPEIEALIAKYPDECQFHNLLSLAYSMEDNFEKESESIISIYQKFPGRINAFANYVIIMSDQNNFDELKKLVGSKFDFHQFFPHRHKISFQEIVDLSGALFAYFTLVTREFHKAIAHAMVLTSFIFSDDLKKKADEILLSAVEMMLADSAKEKNDSEDDISENSLRIVE